MLRSKRLNLVLFVYFTVSAFSFGDQDKTTKNPNIIDTEIPFKATLAFFKDFLTQNKTEVGTQGEVNSQPSIIKSGIDYELNQNTQSDDTNNYSAILNKNGELLYVEILHEPLQTLPVVKQSDNGNH